MKKLFIISTIIICIINAYGHNWVEFTTDESTNPHHSVIKSNDTIVEFEVTIPGIFNMLVDTFNRVNIKEHTRMDSVGLPEVPIVSFLVAIPQCDSVYLNVDLKDSTKINNINIYPAPALTPDTTAGGAIALVEEFAYNRTAYETNAYFPGKLAQAIDKGAIRNQNVVRVVLYPVQFNPVTKTVNAFSKYKITLTFENPTEAINNDVGIFNEVVGNSLINYNSNGLNASINWGAGYIKSGTYKWVTSFSNGYIDDSCDYLIITNQNFYTDTVAKNEIEKLANHRAGFNGFDVAITKMGTINAVFSDTLDLDIDEKLKYLVRNTYNDSNALHTYDSKLAYVNLFGDLIMESGLDGVPTHEEGYDIYFTQLTYDSTTGQYDPYPDLMIGRCSVDDTGQVQNVVHKIV